jgi:hypothetical protein
MSSRLLTACLLVAILSGLTGELRAQEAAGSEPQSLTGAAADRIAAVTQGWGELGIDTAVRPLHREPMALRILDRTYPRGLGHHANGEIVLDLAGQYRTFSVDIGIQWQGGQHVVIFRILADDKLVFDSGVVREGDAPRSVTIPVEGVEELTLVADDAGDGITCDCANWADPRLVPDPQAVRRPPALGVDLAPFARIATWDPQRMTGTAATRVEEFPAADVRLDVELLPEPDGTYRVPVTDGVGCIGMQWQENRLLRRVALTFPSAADVPAADQIQLQTWSGESAWQGVWEPVAVPATVAERQLVWDLRSQSMARGTQKVRWLWSGLEHPPAVAGLHAYSRSRWITTDLEIQPTQPGGARSVTIDIYNGTLLGPAGSDPLRRTWDGATPLRLQVRSAVTKRYKADRTVLLFAVADVPFGVAVEDVLAHDGVYVPHAGLFVTRDPAVASWQTYARRVGQRQGLLAQVRTLPDQAFEQAMAKVHNPIQDLGPMMISLACDCRKFVAEREGRVLFDSYAQFDDPERPIPTQWQLTPRFGRGGELPVTRHLAGGWLPAPTITVQDGEVAYSQCTYVAPIDEAPPLGSPPWVRERAVAVIEFALTNSSQEDRAGSLELTLAPGQAGAAPVVWEPVEGGVIVKSGDRLLALLRLDPDAPGEVRTNGPTVTVAATLTAGATSRCDVYLPAWPAEPGDAALVTGAAPYLPRLDRYWTGLLQPAMQVELPDKFLTQVMRASQVHCLLAARNEDAGRRVSPWISSDRYGPLESEANSIIRGMGLLGHDEFARRSLDYFLARYNDAGYLTTGYTMVGTGEHLWTLAEHYARDPDTEWLQAVAGDVARVCRWVAAQRAKTQLRDARGGQVPEYGLFPPGVTADWNRYAYRFFNDAQYCHGLEAAATMLASIQHPDAAALQDAARQYRADVVRAYRWTQARTPVVALENGTWVPGDPALLDCPGRVDDFLPGEDGNRSWAYSVEIGAHHLAATGLLDPAAPDVGWMMEYLEEQQLLRTGMGDYPEERNREDPYNLGGFGKVQPYYGRFAEVYALRDDVKPFIRAYFNAIPSLLSRENLSFWEHFHNIAGWNKTHETGWFLCQSRIMLVMERGEDLWLAPLTTSAWLDDGEQIVVRAAPTRFGRVSYTLRSEVGQGRIVATIDGPDRASPARVVLRVRHPEGRRIRGVTVDGQPHAQFDADAETVTLGPSRSVRQVLVMY